MNTSNKQAEQANTPPNQLKIKDKYIVENATVWADLSMSIGNLQESNSNGSIGTRQGILQRREQRRRWMADNNKRIKEYLRSLIRGNKTDPFLLVPVENVVIGLQDKLDDEPNEIIKGQILRTLNLVKKDMEDGVVHYITDGQNRLRLAIIPFLNGDVKEKGKEDVEGIRLGEQDLKIREIVTDGPDVMHSLAGKKFDDLSADIQKFIRDINVPLCEALQGTIDDFTDSLIDKNEGIPWTPWMKYLTKNTFTEYRAQIEEVFEEDSIVADRVFAHLGTDAYKFENDGYERFISEMLIWMHSQKQPALNKIDGHVQYFQGLPGCIVPDNCVTDLKHYLNEFAKHGCTRKTKEGFLFSKKCNMMVRNYIMFRFMLDHKNDFKSKFTVPNWVAKNKEEFVPQFILKHEALYEEKGALIPVKGVNNKGQTVTNTLKVPLFFPWANSEYLEQYLDQRLIKLIEFFEKDSVNLLKEGVIKIDDKTPMKSKGKMYDENPHDYKGRKLKASEVVRGELVDRGHKTPKSQGGSNTDLSFQGKKSNLSYGANSL